MGLPLLAAVSCCGSVIMQVHSQFYVQVAMFNEAWAIDWAFTDALLGWLK
jgi:hypothetical protein